MRKLVGDIEDNDLKLLVIFLLPLLLPSKTVAEALVDEIVAVAGDHPILSSEAREKVDTGPLIVISDYPSPPTASKMTRALNDLINIQLVNAKLDELEIEVTPEQVKKQISAFLQGRGLTQADLLEFLRSQGKTSADYERDFKNQLRVRQFQQAVIVPDIKVTDADVKTLYLKKFGHTSDLVTLSLHQILVPSDQKDTIEKVHQQLRAGTLDFAQAIKLYHDPEVSAVMPKLLLKDLAVEIRASVKDLEEGEFTPPVQTASGYHIFYLAAKTLKDDSDFQARKEELELELKNAELQKQTRLWLQRQRAQSGVKILVDHR